MKETECDYLNRKISDFAADATDICRSLPLGGSLAATINLKNVEAPKVEPPRQLQMHSGQRVTSRVDSGQDNLCKKSRTKSARQERIQITTNATAQESFTQIDRMVRLVVKDSPSHPEPRHEPVGIVKSCVPFARARQTAVRGHHRKKRNLVSGSDASV